MVVHGFVLDFEAVPSGEDAGLLPGLCRLTGLFIEGDGQSCHMAAQRVLHQHLRSLSDECLFVHKIISVATKLYFGTQYPKSQTFLNRTDKALADLRIPKLHFEQVRPRPPLLNRYQLDQLHILSVIVDVFCFGLSLNHQPLVHQYLRLDGSHDHVVLAIRYVLLDTDDDVSEDLLAVVLSEVVGLALYDGRCAHFVGVFAC